MLDYHTQALIPLGLASRVGAPELSVSDEESQVAEQIISYHGLMNKKWVMLHPAARYWFKAWPSERFAALGEGFSKEVFQVALIGSEHERPVVEEVMQASRHPLVSFFGKTSFCKSWQG